MREKSEVQGSLSAFSGLSTEATWPCSTEAKAKHPFGQLQVKGSARPAAGVSGSRFPFSLYTAVATQRCSSRRRSRGDCSAAASYTCFGRSPSVFVTRCGCIGACSSGMLGGTATVDARGACFDTLKSLSSGRKVPWVSLMEEGHVVSLAVERSSSGLSRWTHASYCFRTAKRR